MVTGTFLFLLVHFFFPSPYQDFLYLRFVFGWWELGNVAGIVVLCNFCNDLQRINILGRVLQIYVGVLFDFGGWRWNLRWEKQDFSLRFEMTVGAGVWAWPYRE